EGEGERLEAPSPCEGEGERLEAPSPCEGEGERLEAPSPCEGEGWGGVCSSCARSRASPQVTMGTGVLRVSVVARTQAASSPVSQKRRSSWWPLASAK